MSNKPNLILITIDALRVDHLGFMGYDKGVSPNIDSLAKESIVFKNAFSVGPNTSYSFPSILTSTYPLDYQGPEEIKEPRALISEVFQKQGFITAAFHSNPYLSNYFGYDKGWDVFKDINFSIKSSVSGRFKKRFNKLLIFTFPKIFFWIAYLKYRINGPKNTRVRASLINQVAKDFILSLKKENKPFFVWIHYLDIHTPPSCYSEGKVCSYSELIGDCVSSAIRTNGNKGALKRFIRKNFKKYLSKTISLYDEEIKHLDKEIGSLLSFLKEQNIYQNSILCVTADHGDEFLEHGGVGHDTQLYNEVLAVPLLIKSEESVSASKVIEYKVSLIDLAPTLCDLARVGKDSAFKGKSLFNKREDLIFHQSASSKKESHHLNQRKVACQSSNWKYILDHGAKKEELYNLLSDPGEKDNIIKSNPEILFEIRKKVEEFEKINKPVLWKNN